MIHHAFFDSRFVRIPHGAVCHVILQKLKRSFLTRKSANQRRRPSGDTPHFINLTKLFNLYYFRSSNTYFYTVGLNIFVESERFCTLYLMFFILLIHIIHWYSVEIKPEICMGLKNLLALTVFILTESSFGFDYSYNNLL